MPYDIKRTDDSEKPWGVYKRDDGSLIGKHETKSKARAQIAAIYLSEGHRPWTHYLR